MQSPCRQTLIERKSIFYSSLWRLDEQHDFNNTTVKMTASSDAAKEKARSKRHAASLTCVRDFHREFQNALATNRFACRRSVLSGGSSVSSNRFHPARARSIAAAAAESNRRSPLSV